MNYVSNELCFQLKLLHLGHLTPVDILTSNLFEFYALSMLKNSIPSKEQLVKHFLYIITCFMYDVDRWRFNLMYYLCFN